MIRGVVERLQNAVDGWGESYGVMTALRLARDPIVTTGAAWNRLPFPRRVR